MTTPLVRDQAQEAWQHATHIRDLCKLLDNRGEELMAEISDAEAGIMYEQLLRFRNDSRAAIRRYQFLLGTRRPDPIEVDA